MHSANQATNVGDRVALYQTIREATLAQRQALETDDFDRFHELVVEREELIARAEQAKVPEPSDPQGRMATAGLIRDILELDEANQHLLSQKLEEARKELNILRGGRQLVRRYGAAAPAESRFVDRQG